MKTLGVVSLLLLALGLPGAASAMGYFHGKTVTYYEIDGSQIPITEIDFLRLVSAQFQIDDQGDRVVRWIRTIHSNGKVSSFEVRIKDGQTGPDATGVTGGEVWMDLPPPAVMDFYEYKCWPAASCVRGNPYRAGRHLTNTFQDAAPITTLVRYLTAWTDFDSMGYEFIVPQGWTGHDVIQGTPPDQDPNPCPPCTDDW